MTNLEGTQSGPELPFTTWSSIN